MVDKSTSRSPEVYDLTCDDHEGEVSAPRLSPDHNDIVIHPIKSISVQNPVLVARIHIEAKEFHKHKHCSSNAENAGRHFCTASKPSETILRWHCFVRIKLQFECKDTDVGKQC